MKPLLTVIAAAAIICQPLLATERINSDEVIHLLASGDQKAAEEKLVMILARNPRNPEYGFLNAVLARSRFNVRDAAPGFVHVIKDRPNTPEGLASACILGIDLSKDQGSAMYYYNALLVVCEKNPNSIPIHWMAAVMARTLAIGNKYNIGSDMRTRVLLCGVREYETVLALMAPGPGPVLVHQTMANLLDDLDGYDIAMKHRETAMKMERTSWTMQAAACTVFGLGRAEEALPMAKEAVSMKEDDPKYVDLLGQIYWRLGMTTEALNAFDKASRLNPANLEYCKKCVMAYRFSGNYTAARECARRALAKAPGDRFFKIWDARLAAMLGEPGAGALVRQAGQFDFHGNPVDCGAPSPDPWFAAAYTGDFQAIKRLMGTEDINRHDNDLGQTALMVAACNGWDTIAAQLIRAGTELDEKDNNGDTALHYSAQYNNPGVMKLLLDAGANPNLPDKWKQTPLIQSIPGRHWDGFRLLIEKNADVTIFNPSNGNALHYAAGYGDVAMLNLLIRHGANVNATNRSGATPLIEAAKEYPHSHIVTPLITAGADVNARDNEGRTALHHAVDPLLNIPLVELLLDQGANPTLCDKAGVTPITKARQMGFEEIAGMMEKKAGRTEPFSLPRMVPNAGLSQVQKKASCFVIPILLAQGDPLGRPSGVQANDKGAARKELDRMFGIQNARELKDEMEALKDFEPRHREDAGDLQLDILRQLAVEIYKNAVRKIHASCDPEGVGETAWTQSHIIFLAGLGIRAGFLTPEEGAVLSANASKELTRSFSSWPRFLKSFVLGARFHQGWEAGRYEHICQRILNAGLQWP